MQVLKFGGTSLSNVTKFLDVSKIIESKFQQTETAVVLSAPAKITNYLDQINQSIITKCDIEPILQKIKKIFYELSNNIIKNQKNFPNIKINKYIDNKIEYLKNQIKYVSLHQKNIDKNFAEIISTGEIISVKIMSTLFIAKKYSVFIIHPEQQIIATNDYLDANVKIKESKNNIQKLKIPKKHIIFMPGFIAGNKKKELVTLGRNGSDYSAAILSVCLDAKICEIWTDVDGVYTADPRIVPNAKLLQKLSYQEAIELSSFGATVLHPKTILPLSQFNIKCIIKNTYFPENLGTIITNNIKKPIESIKGITYLGNITLITIKIDTIDFMESIINKLFLFFYKNKNRILSTINSYLEKKIFFYIIQKKTNRIKNCLIEKIKNELTDYIINYIHIDTKINMISIVGSNIQKNDKIKKKIFHALEKTNFKIITINTQNSENSINIITNNKNITENIQIIHDQILHPIHTIEIFIIGIGGVGTALIEQIQTQQKKLKDKNIEFKICGIANSKNMLINLQGINLTTWKKDFYQSKTKFCIKQLIQYGKNISLFNPVVVDCTASQTITNEYYNILKNNIHIVTPNKKANTDSWEKYTKIRKISMKSNKNFLYETNVSAGLPIIKTLKNLFDSGDKLINFRGILSGSLSFIFGKLEEGLSISEATIMAKKLGFTEPNPKDDLSGIDVARKILILAREAGYKLELNDINIIPILPGHLLDIKNEKIFFKELKKLDTFFLKKIKNAQDNKKVLRFIGTIQKEGCCRVQLTEIDQTDPLYNVKNGENALIIHSKYYQPMPLVLRGYGAGNNVTAAGIFSDLLQILS
ncbi:bifunctional aspartate kinase/homoserine dehydrogenase I [Buchnera aphidicola]|uniref:Bifunctional aspartokinase/homoserine dehydrogenase n=1 Tax=Buchnera aphidicola (Sarucallis kahawaluokalani) TaxID=1241878 RepID=A0A4D6Y9T7_9GAMM|nr:bifunctional aspartate kinase/homoserine dehydrogenase I [Buchnera aphidicola]QCI25942.1 bifunctional aspartate kinase/homoserine dehydrogenase I [Buchnera aphidicola (Sarucallis kahawaluokalani)]